MIFEDQVRWIARIPLKKHTTIPVPQVYGYAIGSDHRNSTGVSYILMEKLSGQPLPVLEDMDLEPNARDLALARKVHQQLADVTLELGEHIKTF